MLNEDPNALIVAKSFEAKIEQNVKLSIFLDNYVSNSVR